jgi:glycine/serine hydroxymethyltransferase
MKEAEMRVVADLMSRVLSDAGGEATARDVRERTRELCEAFPLYAGLR